MNNIQNLAAPVGRLLLSIMFIMSGLNKISGYEGTQGYMEAMGVPGFMLPLVILLEVAGGIAIVVGFKTRIVAFLFAGFCLVSAALFHNNFEDQMQMIMFMKNLSLAGAFLLLVHGAGAYSMDNRK